MLLFILGLIPFYFIGAIPTGLLVSKYYQIDIAAQGSGNIGATNVARVIGKKAGILTLLLDIVKGALAIGIAAISSDTLLFEALAGAVAVLGHCIAIPGKLKGGRGVATSLGVILSLSPLSALGGLLIFALVFALSQIVSISSIAAALCIPIFGLIFHIPDETLYTLIFIAMLVIYRHKENLIRLVEGQEAKFGVAKK